VDFLSPLTFYEASRFVLPIGWTPLTDTREKETNGWTDEETHLLSVRPFVRSSQTEFDEKQRCAFSSAKDKFPNFIHT